VEKKENENLNKGAKLWKFEYVGSKLLVLAVTGACRLPEMDTESSNYIFHSHSVMVGANLHSS